MNAQILGKKDTPFEGCCNSISLLLGIEWELLIVQIKIIKFYWTEDERTLYFRFKSSLEASWHKQIKVLLLFD